MQDAITVAVSAQELAIHARDLVQHLAEDVRRVMTEPEALWRPRALKIQRALEALAAAERLVEVVDPTGEARHLASFAYGDRIRANYQNR